jgi:dTDP-4-amino-4,6-dideoxygalactose transaminase
MLVARNDQKTAHAKHLSTQAKDDEVYFVHNEIGFNYRMTNLQAAVGVAQLEQLEGFIAAKGANYEHYISLGLPLLPFRECIRPNYWHYSYCSANRDELIRALSERGIQSRPVWKLIHTLPMYAGCEAFEISKATHYYDLIVNIPCSSGLTKEEVERVAGEITLFIAQ